ncbi:MAG TPA: chaperonin [Bacteroidales bacterium]|nr:MAG: chaperonin [Bacteroidetes bacterium GWE2_42_24]OFY31841.1 MAG: chaperonin [Bacteroidetes bacterium GWF2_43_11]PKP23526.1 MAG: chaperonin [Bacteroidetes bacterium HGW-Bacteroidetes-22]HAQ65408.1 chaperonin [Bacteroidales bacterium]HBZ66477.1 chaperonin [Bacteroidales bacterium]
MMNGEKLKNLIVVGDRVLIKARTQNTATPGGLLLPPGYSTKEEIRYGYVIKTGPGYPIPLPSENHDEPWKRQDESSSYMPLQAKEGDLAAFLWKNAIEITIEGEKYYVISHAAILILERDPELFA